MEKQSTSIQDNILDIESLFGKAGVTFFKYKEEMVHAYEEFNIFTLLREEHEEVKLHSRFVGELLNVKGSHRMRTEFLNLFVEACGISGEFFTDSCEDMSVEVEKFAYGEGRIDIFINNLKFKKAILIENKIYADDQHRQLERYFSYVTDHLGYASSDVEIVYLTLDGAAPSAESLGRLGLSDVRCVSYENEIDKWIEKCISVSALNPPVRETLRQYQNLVRKITGKSMSNNYISDLRKLLDETPEYFYLADDISQALVEQKIIIQKRFWQELREEFTLGVRAHGFRAMDDNFSAITRYYTGGRAGYYGLSFLLIELGQGASRTDVVFHLGVESGELFMGFAACDSQMKQTKISGSEFCSALYAGLKNDHKELSSSDYWAGWKYASDKDVFRNIGKRNKDELSDESKRNKFIDELVKEMSELLGSAEQVCAELDVMQET